MWRRLTDQNHNILILSIEEMQNRDALKDAQGEKKQCIEANHPKKRAFAEKMRLEKKKPNG